jgi:hypothetical protein
MEYDKRFVIKARLSPMSMRGDQIDLFAFQSGDGGHYAANKLEMKQCHEHEVISSFLTIDKSEAQILMDDLWSAGVRPTEGTGSAGSLKATQNHLEDLKKILFHKLGINK